MKYTIYIYKCNNLVIKLLLILTGVLFTFLSYSQEIKKDVTVVKSYIPILQDFQKINLLPEFNDTNKITTHFSYSISPSVLNLPFQPRPVSAAKMAQDPLKNLYNTYIRLGIGNNTSPLAELSVTNGRSKENMYGIYLKHFSANGKVLLDNRLKSKAPFADNRAEIFGRHLFKDNVINGSFQYLNNKATFYGIDPKLNLTLNPDSFLQRFQQVKSNFSIASLETDSDKLSYKFDGSYNYITDRFNVADNHFHFLGRAGKSVNEFYISGDLGYDHYIAGGANDSVFNTIFSISPSLSKSKGDWRFELGMELVFDKNQDSSYFYPFPKATLEFNIAPGTLRASISYTGNVEQNGLAKAVGYNPFVLPGIRLKNTIHSAVVGGTLKCTISKDAEIVTSITYDKIDNQYFFINDSSTANKNYFNVVYDNVELLKLSGETRIHATEKLQIVANAEYNNYTMLKEKKPWHLPSFRGNLSLKYNIRDKILAEVDLFIVGRRFAKDESIGKTLTLKSFADLNFGIEYRYTKLLSFFLQFKNITASQYQYWNQYPVYRFQAIAGLTYAL